MEEVEEWYSDSGESVPDSWSSEKLTKAWVQVLPTPCLSSSYLELSELQHGPGIKRMIQHVRNGSLAVLGNYVHLRGSVEHVPEIHIQAGASVAASSEWTEAGARNSRSLSELSHTRRCHIPLAQPWELQHMALSCRKE